jgi:hypothetical protein
VVESVLSCEGVIDVGSRGMLIAEMMRMALGRGLGLLLCYSWPQYQSLYNETGQIKCISTAVSLHSTSSFRTSVTVSLALSSLLLIAASHKTHTRVMHLAIWHTFCMTLFGPQICLRRHELFATGKGSRSHWISRILTRSIPSMTFSGLHLDKVNFNTLYSSLLAFWKLASLSGSALSLRSWK